MRQRAARARRILRLTVGAAALGIPSALFLAAGALPLAAQPPAQLRIVPEVSEVGLGENFEVEVEVSGVSDLAAYRFTLEFEPRAVTYVRIRPGDFLSSTGRTVYVAPVVVRENYVVFTAASRGQTPEEPGVSGTGTLAVARFGAANAGESTLGLNEVILLNTQENDLPHAEHGARVRVIAEPTPTLGPSPTPAGSPTPTAPAAIIDLPIASKRGL